MTKKVPDVRSEDLGEKAQLDTISIKGAIVSKSWDQVQECILVAHILVDQYGKDAPLKAEASASKLLLDWADLEAWAYWKRAGRAARQLLQVEPAGTIH